jgi:hypothetical protein
MAPLWPDDRTAYAPSVVVLGTDAVLAAAPATPVQLAHACLAAGYAAVVPASWGDELIATAATKLLARRPGSPAVFCACPLVAHRLLRAGEDLTPFIVSTVAPPVATARYVRALYGQQPVRVTFVGRCPAAADDAIDARFTPAEFLTSLAERGIDLAAQPEVFDSVLPPDRRRHASLPGGVPTAEALRRAGITRELVEIEGPDLATQLSRHLLAGTQALIDLAPRQGCACSGALAGGAPAQVRRAVADLEPPRSPASVVDTTLGVSVELPLPRASRHPGDVVPSAAVLPPPAPVAAPAPPTPSTPPALAGPAAPEPRAVRRESREAPAADPITPTEPMPALPPHGAEGREAGGSLRRRSPLHTPSRPVPGILPTTRQGEGVVLPRAYVARRRSSLAIPPVGDEVLGVTAEPREARREIERAVEPRTPREGTTPPAESPPVPPSSPPPDDASPSDGPAVPGAAGMAAAGAPAAAPAAGNTASVAPPEAVDEVQVTETLPTPASALDMPRTPPGPAAPDERATPDEPAAPDMHAAPDTHAAPDAPARDAPRASEEGRSPPPAGAWPGAGPAERVAAARAAAAATLAHYHGWRVEMLVAAALAIGLTVGLLVNLQNGNAETHETGGSTMIAPTEGDGVEAGSGAETTPSRPPRPAGRRTPPAAPAASGAGRRAARASAPVAAAAPTPADTAMLADTATLADTMSASAEPAPGAPPAERPAEIPPEAAALPAAPSDSAGPADTTGAPVPADTTGGAPAGPVDTAVASPATQRTVIEEELRRRRARIDSLRRSLDSLAALPPDA